MNIYKYGNTLHLYPECRGTKGEKIVVPDHTDSQSVPDCKICGICRQREARKFRAKEMRKYKNDGWSYSDIGKVFGGISRQAVAQLLGESQ